MYLSRLGEMLIKRGLVIESKHNGCNPQEIRLVAEACGGRLPDAYVEFLERFGKANGKIFLGTDIYYPIVLKLKAWVDELLRESESSFTLPSDAIVFAMHQGYEFFYIQRTDGENPPVYFYVEGWRKAEQKSESFSGFMEAMVDEAW